ncbi:MAG: ABC transporter substrate-binding protein [Mesorhizobium sp.]
MRFVSLLPALFAGALIVLPATAADLKIALQEDPDMLDPAQGQTFVGRMVFAALCDKLVDMSPKGEIVPQLATEWHWSDDGLALTMKLRQGVKFHDETPFNADAAVAVITRMMTMPESKQKTALRSVEKIEATDEYQIKFTMKEPDATLLSNLSDRAGMMISPAAAKEQGADFGNKPVCSGPFKFLERVQQSRIVLEKFQDYWNKDNIFIDKVTYVPIPDTTVRLANLRAGDLDMIERLSASDVEAVKADPDLTYQSVVGTGWLGIYFNVGNGPRAQNPLGQDKRLRQAFSLAIDREVANQIVYQGTSVAGNQPFSPESPWYNKDFPVPARDIEKARALVKEAGYDRVPVEMLATNNPVVMQMMEIIQSMVAEAGFDVSLRAVEFTTLIDEIVAGNYQAGRGDYSGRADPDPNVYQFMACKGQANDTKYCNPEADKLLNEARQSTDTAVRKQKYDAFIALLLDDVPTAYIGHQSWLYALRKNVTGFVPTPDGLIRLTGIKKAD